MASDVKIFKPSKRRLVDFLLMINFVLFLFLAFRVFPSFVFWPLALVLNSLFLLTWFFAVSPLVKVRLEKNVLSGRGAGFEKVSIPLRKVNFQRTMSRTYGLQHRLFKDVWSIEGKRIRLQRKLFSESQIAEILHAIEKYPFREGGGSAADKPVQS